MFSLRSINLPIAKASSMLFQHCAMHVKNLFARIKINQNDKKNRLRAKQKRLFLNMKVEKVKNRIIKLHGKLTLQTTIICRPVEM